MAPISQDKVYNGIPPEKFTVAEPSNAVGELAAVPTTLTDSGGGELMKALKANEHPLPSVTTA